MGVSLLLDSNPLHPKQLTRIRLGAFVHRSLAETNDHGSRRLQYLLEDDCLVMLFILGSIEKCYIFIMLDEFF